MRKSSLFFFRISFFRISKERLSKERSIYAYIRTNEFFLSKRISKERQTNFERTLFDQTTYPALIVASSGSYFCWICSKFFSICILIRRPACLVGWLGRSELLIKESRDKLKYLFVLGQENKRLFLVTYLNSHFNILFLILITNLKWMWADIVWRIIFSINVGRVVLQNKWEKLWL